MRFFLKVELVGAGEVWELYNQDLNKVSQIEDPGDPSIGRLVQAALRLDEATFGPPENASADEGGAAPKAWLVFSVSDS